MKVTHFDGMTSVETPKELRLVLDHRTDEGFNGFWLFHDQEFPRLAILVNRDAAVVHYFPRAGHPGFVSDDPGKSSALVRFHVAHAGDEGALPGYQTVTLERAISAAVQFLERPHSLPPALCWFEL